MQLLQILYEKIRIGDARAEATLEELGKAVKASTDKIQKRLEKLASKGYLDDLVIDEKGKLRCVLRRVL